MRQVSIAVKHTLIFTFSTPNFLFFDLKITARNVSGPYSTKPRGSEPGGTASPPAPFTVGWFESEWNFIAPFALQHFSSLGVSLHTHPAGMLSEFSIYLEKGDYFIALSLVLFLSLSPQFPPSNSPWERSPHPAFRRDVNFTGCSIIHCFGITFSFCSPEGIKNYI